MRQQIIFTAMILLAPFAHASTKGFAMGFGMESRLQREVNPDFADLQYTPQGYLKFSSFPWAALVEAGAGGRTSSSGSLQVNSETYNFAGWGRYEFLERNWSPFAGLGLGMYYDKVETKFQYSRDERSGIRKFLGLSGGLTATFWQHLLLEGEGRMSLVEHSKDPAFAFLLRVGYQFY